MKKLFTFFLLSIFFALLAIAVFADTQIVDGVTYEYYSTSDGTTITNVSTSSSEIRIPNTLGGLPVTSIGKHSVWDQHTKQSYYVGAFGGNNRITSVIIPDTVKTIDDYAFRNCSNLTSITLPENITHIGEQSFSGCRSLVSIVLPQKLKRLGSHAFDNCSSLANITLPEDCQNLSKTAFLNTPFYNDASKWSFGCFYIGNTLLAVNNPAGNALIVLPGTQYIAPEAAEGCTSLEYVSLPESIVSIGASAFADCTSLSTVNLSAGITHIGSSAFKNTAFFNDANNWSNNVLYLGTYLIAVNDDYKYEESPIRQGTTIIADSAFTYVSTFITDLTIPGSVTHIGAGAFATVSATNVKIQPGTVFIGEDAFGTIYNNITIPDTVQNSVEVTIGASHLDCRRILYIGANVPVSEISINYNTNEFILSSHNPNFCLEDNVLYNKDKTELIAFPYAYQQKEYVIPDGVSRIAANAFANVDIEKVVFPQSLTYIGDCAFYGCDINSITLPENIKHIGKCAFTNTGYYNTKSNWIDGVLYIGNCLYEVDSKRDRLLVVKESTKVIADSAFAEAESLKTLIIKNESIDIPDSAFDRCKKLEKISFKKTIGRDSNYSTANLDFVGTYADSPCTIPLASTANFATGTVIYEKWIPKHTSK